MWTIDALSVLMLAVVDVWFRWLYNEMYNEMCWVGRGGVGMFRWLYNEMCWVGKEQE